ncbi:hypothetical protein BN1200_420013 [Klebsiella variicola]|nr:hypothetical protein BN1200_420013 [Klebsiella variicola]
MTMSTKPFVYQDPFPLAHDDTEYYLLSKEHVSVAEFDGQPVLKVEPQALTLLAQQAFHDAAFMLRVSHQQQVASILLDPEAAKTTNTWRYSSCATPKSPPKVFCRPVRIPAPPSSWVKKASASGPAVAMKPPWRRAFTTPIPKITCVTHRTRRWICIKRSTLAPTCRRRSISTASTVTNINSCAWRKAAVPPIKPISIRKPKR